MCVSMGEGGRHVYHVAWQAVISLCLPSYKAGVTMCGTPPAGSERGKEVEGISSAQA